MSIPTDSTPQATAEAPDKGVGCDALLAGLRDAITEARSLDSNTDPLVDTILTPLIAEARRLAAYIEELEGNYGAEMARADTACYALEQIRDNAMQAYAHRVSAPSVIAMCNEGLGSSSANKPDEERPAGRNS